MRALFILDYTNPWYDNGAPPHSEAARAGFTRGPCGSDAFPRKGIIWETYDELNISQFWPPQPDLDDYIKLALSVGRAFRLSVPHEELVGAATSGMDFDFLESCFKAGLLEYWSAVSVHPYRRSDPESAAKDFCRLRTMIERYSPAIFTNGQNGPGDGNGRVAEGEPQKGRKQIPIIAANGATRQHGVVSTTTDKGNVSAPVAGQRGEWRGFNGLVRLAR